MIQVSNRKQNRGGFMNQQKALNNAGSSKNTFNEEIALMNNVRSAKQKIELPEEYTMKKETKPKNEFVEFNKTNSNSINSAQVTKAEKKRIDELRADFNPKDYDQVLDHAIYKYEIKVREQQQEQKPFADLASRTQQYINQFNGFANNSIFQNMVGIAARVIAPPPTENQIMTIKDRIKRLDPSLISDIFTISQIIQSPEIMSYIRSLYEHVKNFVSTDKDLKYITDLIKPIIDYITINSDKFSMSSSPWLLEAYQKIKGVFYTSPTMSPNTPAPIPVTTSETTYNFQSDSTSAPTERHENAPSQVIPFPRSMGMTYEQAQQQPPAPPPAPAPAPPIQTPAPIRQQLTGNMQIIYETYTDAFTTRAKLENFYLQLLGVGLSNAFMQIRQYILQRPIGVEQMRTTATSILTGNLIGALEYVGTMPDWAMQEFRNTAQRINGDPSFFFRP